MALVQLIRQVFLSLLLTGAILVNISEATAQRPIGFVMPDGVKFTRVEFELISNLIVIPIQINNKITLKFILDTGAETSILTEDIFGSFLGLNYVREMVLQGPGLIDSIEARVAANVKMALPGGIVGHGLNMLVLKEDYLQLNKNLGEDIYGIIGYDLFKRFVVEIDYDERVIIFHDPNKYRPRRWKRRVSMKVLNSKPYINLKIRQDHGVDSLDFMIDTGASHALLLDVNNSDNIHKPEKVINTLLGQGLGGDIPGYMGRLDKIRCNKYEFDDVLVSFPAPGIYLKAIKRGSEHGTIGGEILSRFNLTFDYQNGYLYLIRGQSYKEKFDANMSGMFLTSLGDNYDSLVVSQVYPDTPADRAGIKPGDHVLKVNNLNSDNSSLSEIQAFFRKKEGMKIKILLNIDGEKVVKEFRLERLI